MQLDGSLCTPVAPYYGYMGIVFAMALSNVGAAYGTAKAGVGIMSSGVSSPDLIYKNLIPIIMAGVNGIYGLISSIVISNTIVPPDDYGNNVYSMHNGFAHLAAGMCVGLAGMASGMAIGVAGDAGVRAFGQLDFEAKKGKLMRAGTGMMARGRQKKKNPNDLYVSMVLIQVFSGNLALFGLITAMILSQEHYECIAEQ